MHRKFRKLAVAALIAAAFCGNSYGQTMDDYVRAGNAEKGCATIPYTDLRSACERNRDEVYDYCKTGGTCEDLDTAGPQQKINGAKEQISNFERLRDGQRSKRDSAKEDAEKRAAEDEISRLEKEIDGKKRLIEEQTKRFRSGRPAPH